MPIFYPDELRTSSPAIRPLSNVSIQLPRPTCFFPAQLGRVEIRHSRLPAALQHDASLHRACFATPPPNRANDLPILFCWTYCYIPSFVMDVFGVLDNLAWIWFSEKLLTVSKKQTGCDQNAIQSAVPFEEMRDYLAVDAWFADIIDFWDALRTAYVTFRLTSCRKRTMPRMKHWSLKARDEGQGLIRPAMR